MPTSSTQAPRVRGCGPPSIQRTLPIPASNSDNTRLYVMEGTRPALSDLRHEARGAVGLAGLVPATEETLEQPGSGQPRVVVQAHGSRTARPLRWGLVREGRGQQEKGDLDPE